MESTERPRATTARRGGRRQDIIAAARRCIASHGFQRATTAEICEAAGVSSGTFFHYFPTKTAVLAAVLEEDLETTRLAFERIRVAADPDAGLALTRWREHVLSEAADDEMAGFVAAVGTVPDDDRVTAALQAESELARQVLTEVAAAGQRQGTVRQDMTAEQVALWLSVVADGLLAHVAEEAASADVLGLQLQDVVDRLVRP